MHAVLVTSVLEAAGMVDRLRKIPDIAMGLRAYPSCLQSPW